MLNLTSVATAAAAPGGAGFLMQILPFVLIFVVFYFLLIRPQQKKMKEHQEMVSNVSRGDEVVTQGGLIGKVSKVSDDEAIVELADGVKVRVVKSTIADVRNRTEPKTANDTSDDTSDKASDD